VLGGNSEIVGAPGRVPYTKGGADAPKLAGGMDDELFASYLADDDALLRALDADWLLVPMIASPPSDLERGTVPAVASGVPPMQLSNETGLLVLGRGGPASPRSCTSTSVSHSAGASVAAASRMAASSTGTLAKFSSRAASLDAPPGAICHSGTSSGASGERARVPLALT
jgi:hypothetical protein